jgi:hypothetical protein
MGSYSVLQYKTAQYIQYSKENTIPYSTVQYNNTLHTKQHTTLKATTTLKALYGGVVSLESRPL